MVLFNEPRIVNQISVSEAYQICEEITRSASTSFLRSFKSLPVEKRSSVHALYAFCRKVDDIVDGDWLPNLSNLSEEELVSLNQRAEYRAMSLAIKKMSEPSNGDENHFQRVRALLWFRDNLELIEKNITVNHPIFIALKDTSEKFPIRIVDLKLLIEGMEDDLFPTNYESFEDVRSYCFKVASTVGLNLIEIYGYSNPDAREYAEEMGIFLQMVNILRDIKEDRGRGRLYLPTDELKMFDINPEEIGDMNLANTKKWKNFMKHYINRTKTHRNNALNLIPLIEGDSRRNPQMMCAVYSSILSEAEKRNGDVLSRRLQLGFMKKVGFALSALGLWSISTKK
ncbi:MAG: phytoene/squalene synthase family protein [Candidatus Thalassarchaeaceae archaeon]|nr:phytoene/squalene synthase family protein [Candidatus Thalassarchaeaceae archaeon]